MAKVRRANHRGGADRSQWPQGRTTDQNGLQGGAEDGPADAGAPSVNGSGKPGVGLVGPAPDQPGSAHAGLATPVRLDEIAVAAMALSDGLQAATQDLPESVEARRFRRDLDDAAETFREVAGELESTAGGLVRLAAADGHTCEVTWGICPDHGITLMAVGDELSCRALSCDQVQTVEYERCAQPVAYRVVDATGPALLACSGHAVACRLHLEGAVITLASDSLELL